MKSNITTGCKVKLVKVDLFDAKIGLKNDMVGIVVENFLKHREQLESIKIPEISDETVFVVFKHQLEVIE